MWCDSASIAGSGSRLLFSVGRNGEKPEESIKPADADNADVPADTSEFDRINQLLAEAAETEDGRWTL